MTAKLRTWLGRGALVLLILVALLYSLVPLTARWLVSDWLRQQGLAAEFDYLELAPGIGRVVVGGFARPQPRRPWLCARVADPRSGAVAAGPPAVSG